MGEIAKTNQYPILSVVDEHDLINNDYKQRWEQHNNSRFNEELYAKVKREKEIQEWAKIYQSLTVEELKHILDKRLNEINAIKLLIHKLT